MPCKHIAHFFSCIFAVILAHNGEKSAACVLVIVLTAVDPGKSRAVVFHHRFGIVTAVDHGEKKLLIGIVAVKETLHAHGLS